MLSMQIPKAVEEAAKSLPKTAADHAMTTTGWLFMALSVGGVVALTVWCYAKILGSPNPQDEAIPPAGLGP